MTSGKGPMRWGQGMLRAAAVATGKQSVWGAHSVWTTVWLELRGGERMRSGRQQGPDGAGLVGHFEAFTE